MRCLFQQAGGRRSCRLDGPGLRCYCARRRPGTGWQPLQHDAHWCGSRPARQLPPAGQAPPGYPLSPVADAATKPARLARLRSSRTPSARLSRLRTLRRTRRRRRAARPRRSEPHSCYRTASVLASCLQQHTLRASQTVSLRLASDFQALSESYITNAWASASPASASHGTTLFQEDPPRRRSGSDQ